MSKQAQSKKDISLSRDNNQSVTTLNDDQYQATHNSKLEDFKLAGRLGDGAYSQVYKVRRIHDSAVYALKKVRLNNLSEKEKENAINEVRILASIKHINVISYKEAFIEPTTQSLCIVMEYADNGDLFQKILDHQQDNTQMSEQEIWTIFIQIVRGLKAMHDLNIMHRDLKSANVFLNKDFTVKLGDMNVSKVASQRGLNYTQTGTPYYASPEVWKDEPYGVKSDIWSLGCVLYEMICLKPPFQATDMNGLYKKVIRGQFPRIPKVYSQDLWSVVKSLLVVNPLSRPDCKQLINLIAFQKKVNELFPDSLDKDESELLKTIRVPKNIMYLSNKLPQANYDKQSIKKNSYKMSRSINLGKKYQKDQKSNQNTSMDRNINENKLPTHKVEKQRNEDSQSLPKISSKAKLAAQENHSINIENIQDKRNNYASQELSPKKRGQASPIQNNSLKKKSSKLTLDAQNNSYDQQEIIAQSKTIETPYSNQDIKIKNSTDDKSILNQRDSNIGLLNRESSLQKLKRDNSNDSANFISGSGIKISKAPRVPNHIKLPQQKLQDIYNKQSNKSSIMNSNDSKPIRNLGPVLKSQQLQNSYLLINSSKIHQPYESIAIQDKEPSLMLSRNKDYTKQSSVNIIKQVRQQLFHNGVPKHSQKKSMNYAENLLKIASVYTKGTSLSPLQKQKNRDLSVNSVGHSIGERNNSVSISLSNVKLPTLNNRSVADTSEMQSISGDYQPYENRKSINNGLFSLKSQQKKHQQSMNKNLQSIKELPYSHYVQGLKRQKQYYLNQKRNSEVYRKNTSLSNNDSMALLQVNIKSSGEQSFVVESNKSEVNNTNTSTMV